MHHNVLNDFVEQINVSVALPPHPFTQIRVEHCAVGAMLPFVSHLGVFPRVLNVLDMCPGGRVYEIIRMIHLQMLEPHCSNTPVGSPHVRHDGAAWCRRGTEGCWRAKKTRAPSVLGPQLEYEKKKVLKII